MAKSVKKNIDKKVVEPVVILKKTKRNVVASVVKNDVVEKQLVQKKMDTANFVFSENDLDCRNANDGKY